MYLHSPDWIYLRSCLLTMTIAMKPLIRKQRYSSMAAATLESITRRKNAYGLHWLRKLYGTLSTDIGYPYLYEGNGKSIEIAKPVSSQNQRRVCTALDSPVILCR